jgi:hypothetical protein
MSAARLWWRLFGLSIFALLVAGAFWAGFELGQARQGSMLGARLDLLQDERDRGTDDVARLRDAVEELRQDNIVLERSRHIERETNKSLQGQLRAVQDERLALLKDLNYLKRIIGEGGRGAVRVHDFRVGPEESGAGFAYSFTVTQLIQDFGETRGRVELGLEGVQGGEERALGLASLPGAKPKRLDMSFDHFQTFDGRFELPAGFEPRLLTVTIHPDSDQLRVHSEGFPWPEATAASADGDRGAP